MLAMRCLPREVRKKVPLVVIACCTLLGLYYVRSASQDEPSAEFYQRRKVESTGPQAGSEPTSLSLSHRKGHEANTHFNANSVSPEVNVSGDGLHVRLQQKTVRRPWEGVEGCSQYGIRFAERGALPIVALTSYPGSGNTWTRYMLEMASGVFTGSIYYDVGLYAIGYWGEMSSPEEGTTIVQKVHDFGEDQVARFNRTAIVIVRNPYRAVLSFHNYLFGGHKGMAPSSNYLKKGWRSFVMKQVFEWSAHVQKWTEPSNRVLVVHYEHLKSDLAGQLRRMLHFLNWPVDENRLRCVQADQSGVVKRHQQHRPRVVTPFSAELRTMIDLSIRTVQRVLQRRHLPLLPLDEYEFFNGSSRRAEQLEDCREGETLLDCIYRIDRMNFRYHIKSWFEKIRDHVRAMPLGDAFSEKTNGMRSRVQRLSGTFEDATDAGSESLSPEEEGMVERVMQRAEQSRGKEEPRWDDVLDRFRGLLEEAAPVSREDSVPEDGGRVGVDVGRVKENKDGGRLGESKPAGPVVSYMDGGRVREDKASDDVREEDGGHVVQYKASDHVREKDGGRVVQDKASDHVREKKDGGRVVQDKASDHVREEDGGRVGKDNDGNIVENVKDNGRAERNRQTRYAMDDKDSGRVWEDKNSGRVEQGKGSVRVEENIDKNSGGAGKDKDGGLVAEDKDGNYAERVKDSDRVVDDKEGGRVGEGKDSERVREDTESRRVEENKDFGRVERDGERKRVGEDREDAIVEEDKDGAHVREDNSRRTGKEDGIAKGDVEIVEEHAR